MKYTGRDCVYWSKQATLKETATVQLPQGVPCRNEGPVLPRRAKKLDFVGDPLVFKC